MAPVADSVVRGWLPRGVVYGPSAPADFALELWRRTLVENIRVSHSSLAKQLDTCPGIMQMAYWADAVPHHVPDDNAYCRKLEIQVEKVINERRQSRDRFHVGMGEQVGSFFKDRGMDLAKLLAFHKSHGKLATLTAVRPPARYGSTPSTSKTLASPCRSRNPTVLGEEILTVM